MVGDAYAWDASQVAELEGEQDIAEVRNAGDINRAADPLPQKLEHAPSSETQQGYEFGSLPRTETTILREQTNALSGYRVWLLRIG